MSNPIARKTVGLLHVKEKPLRHGELSLPETSDTYTS
jgi:hypothetical protein